MQSHEKIHRYDKKKKRQTRNYKLIKHKLKVSKSAVQLKWKRKKKEDVRIVFMITN